MSDDTLAAVALIFTMGMVGAIMFIAVMYATRPYNTVMTVRRDGQGNIVEVIERHVPA